jgi:hypothetical protein
LLSPCQQLGGIALAPGVGVGLTSLTIALTVYRPRFTFALKWPSVGWRLATSAPLAARLISTVSPPPVYGGEAGCGYAHGP